MVGLDVRGGVSVAAHQLQAAGLIRYKRGHITVFDRRGRIEIVDRTRLQKAACPCYGIIKRQYDSFVSS